MRSTYPLCLLLSLTIACPQPDDDDSAIDDDDAAVDDDDDSAVADDDDAAVDDDDDDSTDCGADVELGLARARTNGGVFEGVLEGGVIGFRGIPYATPPTGDLRFRPTEPAGCVETLRVAEDWGPMCPQYDAAALVVGEEDCLHLNVWTPAVLPEPTDRLPVLFFMHGGGNVQGASSIQTIGDVRLYDGAQLAARQGVVVVTINYRLGALGFLAHPDLAAESAAGSSGNYGLRDQLLALTWVQDNIEAFGGDPERVLLFGESAGAKDTCSLMTSPLAEGLFSAGLMQSGGCGSPTAEAAQEAGEQHATVAGCGLADDVPDCLRGLPVEVLVALNGDGPIDEGGVVGSAFDSNIDGEVLPASPYATLLAGEHQDVPFVVGANADETSQWVPVLTEAQYIALVTATVGPTLGAEVLAEYPASDYDSPRWAWIAVTTDSQFVCPARRIAAAAAEHKASSVWRYFFTQVPTGASGELYGSWHGLELVYVFQGIDAIEATGQYTPSASDYEVEEAMGALWASLAASGDPGADSGIAWPVYAPDSDPYLEIGATIGAGVGVRTDKCDFWDGLLGG